MLVDSLGTHFNLLKDLQEVDYFLCGVDLNIETLDALLSVADFDFYVGFLLNVHCQVTHFGQRLEVGEEVQVSFNILFIADLLSDVATIWILTAAHPLHHLFNHFFVQSTVVGLPKLQLEVICIDEVRSALSDESSFRVAT